MGVKLLNSNILKADKEILGEIEVTFENEEEGNFNTIFDVKHSSVVDNGVLLYEEEYNKATVYILPILRNNIFRKNIDFFQYMINVYCNEDTIVLKTRYLPFKDYELFSENLTKHSMFTKKETRNRYDLYFFQVPYFLKSEIKKFLKSEFNKFNDNFIQQIAQFNGLRFNDKRYRVLIDDPKYRETLEKELGVPIPNNIPLESKITDKEIWN